MLSLPKPQARDREILAAARQDPGLWRRLTRHHWLVPFGLLAVLAPLIGYSAYLFGYAESKAHRNNLLEVRTQAVHDVSETLFDYVHGLLLLQRLIQSTTEFSEDRFVRLASIFNSEFPDFLALNFIDDARVIRWVTPFERNQSAIGRTVGQTPEIVSIVERARDTLMPTATPPADLFQGGKGIGTYLPLVVGGRFVGYLNGVVRIPDFMPRLTRTIGTGMIVRITDGDAVIFANGSIDDQADRFSQSFPVFDRNWLIEVAYPDNGFVDAEHVAYLAAALAWLLLLISTFFMARSIRRGREIGERDALVSLWANAFAHSTQPQLILSTPQGRVVSCNAAYARLVGAQCASLIDAPALGKDNARIAEMMDRLTAQGDAPGQLCAETTVSRADGTLVPVEVSLSRFAGSNGGDLVLANLVEQTEKIQSERAVRDANDRLNLIMAHTVDGLITIDEHGTVISFSKSAARIFGYAADEVVGRNVNMLMPEPYRSDHDSYLARYIATGVAKLNGAGREVAGRRKDGTIFPIDLAVSELAGVVGHRQFVGTIRDITQRVETEQQLRQAQKMEVVGQLTGGVAHDFNNLLTIILGNLRILSRQPGDPMAAKAIEAAERAAQRGADLTRRLLSFSRRMPLHPEIVDINALVAESADMFKRLLGEQFQISLRLEARPATVRIDKSQLQSALLNLVINARDAMPTGGALRIETQMAPVQAGQGSHLILTVSDTGVGMAPEIMAKVFEPFFTTKPVGKGSGLGLSMVYGFVRQSGGNVTVDSTEGQGASFHLTFPVVEAEATATARSRNAAPSAAGKATGLSVLLVEDDPDVRKVITNQLSYAGHKVQAVGTGTAARDALRSAAAFDCLLTDRMLDGKPDGLDLARMARSLRPQLKVICMSGYASEPAGSADADGIRRLAKPFNEKQLAAVLCDG